MENNKTNKVNKTINEGSGSEIELTFEEGYITIFDVGDKAFVIVHKDELEQINKLAKEIF